MARKQGFVYIMSYVGRTTFYVGVTSNLMCRALEHKRGIGSEFTAKYRCKDLVYFEQIDGIVEAIAREKQLKNWHRPWKLNLIKSMNPEMKDLAANWYHLRDLEGAP